MTEKNCQKSLFTHFFIPQALEGAGSFFFFQVLCERRAFPRRGALPALALNPQVGLVKSFSVEYEASYSPGYSTVSYGNFFSLLLLSRTWKRWLRSTRRRTIYVAWRRA
jgi:hypothetical protein